MKRKLLVTALAVQLAVCSYPAFGFAETATVTASKITIDPISSVRAGSIVSIAGTTDTAEVIVKAVAPNGTILYYNVVQSANGRYSTIFAIPQDASLGTYQIAAGQGANVANSSFNVIRRSDDSSPSYGSSSGSSSGTSNLPASPDKSVTSVNIKAADLPKAQNGLIVLNLTDRTSDNLEVTLPANIIETTADNSLKLDLPNASIIIPKEVLESLANLVPGKPADAYVSLRVKRLSQEEAKNIISSASSEGSNAVMKPQGEAFGLELSVKTKDNQEHRLTVFTKPIILKLRVTAGPEARLAGIYYVADNGTPEYIGGKLEGDMITAGVLHFSTYGVYSYLKSYSDVPERHWASAVIQELTAKHIVQGISPENFGPELNVSRAEFTAMLVRHLNLKSSQPIIFNDVAADSWYAQHVAAAYENGIVQGTNAESFEPNKAITREEMAAMIVRVYEKVSGRKTESAEVRFADGGEVADWAKASVQGAVKAGLMVGRSENSFAPKGVTTRAEASQALYNLLKNQ